MTTPKIKDLVNIHTEKYDAIYDVIHRHSSAREGEKDGEKEKEKEIIELSSLLPIQEQAEPSMKDELKSFLKKQMQTSNEINSSTSIDFLDTKTQFSYLS